MNIGDFSRLYVSSFCPHAPCVKSAASKAQNTHTTHCTAVHTTGFAAHVNGLSSYAEIENTTRGQEKDQDQHYRRPPPPQYTHPYHLAPNNQSPPRSTTPPRRLHARHPRVSSRDSSGAPQDTGGATKASAEYHLPDYTEPEPTRCPRPPKEEGEAARNNVAMSAGIRRKRSCPDIICYLLSIEHAHKIRKSLTGERTNAAQVPQCGSGPSTENIIPNTPPASMKLSARRS